jgi:dihydroxyacid dehydratase/phosphogluconate dehydratase|tara:strand:+ start:302 stop:508 length:207 start_codon:yes stop_codon:yes gene_type:complete
MSFLREKFVVSPVIGIINTWNKINSCHTHLPERVKDLKLGVFSAGGFPLGLPTISLGEQLMKPIEWCT